MAKRITIYDYIASSVPNDAHLLLNKYDKYSRARDVDELSAQLKQFVRKNGEMGLMAIAQIHPDRELLLEAIKETQKESKDNFVNANGGAETQNTATSKISDTTKETINMSKMMIYGSFLLIGLALVIKK